MMRKGTGKNSNSWRIVSSCLKNVSTCASNVVRSAVAAVSSPGNDQKDQVTWAGFGELKFCPNAIKHVLLIAYVNGFQVIDVEDSDNFNELVSKRDLPVIFLEILPAPLKYDVKEQISSLRPILLVVSAKEDSCRRSGQNHYINSQPENPVSPTGTIRFYSFISHCYIKVLSFSSPVLIVRSSPRIIAVGLKSQICCIDACSLEKKFNVSTYPVPEFEGQGQVINTGYGPMAVGPRWLAYTPETPYISSAGHSKNRSFPGISPSKSPGNGSLMAHFAMQCGKQVATAMMNFRDRGCKTLSEHYPDFLSDVATSSVQNGGKTAQEMENAGTIAIKDVLSTAIITQFRAHTSPISALCFDPSGTLLVTASIHGNNINIFRIMPLARCKGSTFYDWNSSRIHLYKLYRGITSAMIRDICFSQCCRWVSIVSSKGTCHIFLLPPLVGDATVQTCHSHLKDTSSSRPWWSSSSFTLKEQQSFPSSPSTFTVATRIKDMSFSFLHMKNVAAASASGMKLAPSGALATIFHTSIADDGLQDLHLATSSLEHLLVFTPTGFVVQYKLLPSAATELSDVSPKIQPSLHVNTQDDLDEVFRVNVQPVQWWDVCRRSDHSERRDYSLGTALNEVEDSAKVDSPKMLLLEESSGLIKSVKTDRIKDAEISNWYILNAEVQMHSARYPIWQRSKICFHVMTPPISQGSSCGELEIEKFSSHEVEIKDNDLQPVFDHFRSMKSPWGDKKCNRPALPHLSHRGAGLEYDTSSSSLVRHQCRDMVNEAIVVCHSNPASLGSKGSSDGGSSTPLENLLDLDLLSDDNPPVASRYTLNDLSEEETGNVKYGTHNSTFSGFHPELSKMTFSTEITDDDTAAEVPSIVVKESVGSVQAFEDIYHTTPVRFSPTQLAKVVTDELENSSVSCKEEEPEDDGVLGGLFDL